MRDSRLKKETWKTKLEHQTTPNNNILNMLKENRQKLNDLLTYKAEEQLRFTNKKYDEFGNRASRLLAFQLRKLQSSRAVHKKVSKYGGSVISTQGICQLLSGII